MNITEIEETVRKCQPVLVDNADEVEEGENGAKEEEESFSVYFPDGSMTEVYGCQNSACDFKMVVSDTQNKGFDGEVVSNMSREFAKDYVGNTFVSSCLLQMPYVRGSCDEVRYSATGEDRVQWNLDEYAEHLSLISAPTFHRLCLF